MQNGALSDIGSLERSATGVVELEGGIHKVPLQYFKHSLLCTCDRDAAG